MTYFFITFILLLLPSSLSSTSFLNGGSSLSAENINKTLVSPDTVFSAGFYPNGENAFLFAIWFTKSRDKTVIWSANGDQPVNGKRSKLSLNKNGNLVLTDAGKFIIWSTRTTSKSSPRLSLLNSGNLIITSAENPVIWQTFDYPTNTLLPSQVLTRDIRLISSRSQTNYSSGFYKLFFDDDNILKLLYGSPDITSIYWPDPWRMSWDVGRTSFNSSKIAILDNYGFFLSSDTYNFSASDFGPGPYRRLTIDSDGCLRLYSLDDLTGDWTVTWQGTLDPCNNHGICGPNSICSYSTMGRGCSCLPGYEAKNLSDWSYGCSLTENKYKDVYKIKFVIVNHIELYGYEYDVYQNVTLDHCKEQCLKLSVCQGFLFKIVNGYINCYAKSQFHNAKHWSGLIGILYVKLNVSEKKGVWKNPFQEVRLNCSGEKKVTLNRDYQTYHGSNILEFLVYFATGVGVVEFIIIITISYFVFMAPKEPDQGANGYFLAATGFRRFSYSELKKGTRGFTEEIGQGGNGIVYRGTLLDSRIAAVKRLNDTNGGEVEFLAELSIIGKLNHMNLIEMWGYCVEGKHRVIVSEYMENGSLFQNLYSNKLDCEQICNIAVGIAKGLAYLHEECLEWVLHCDIKPQNILLDSTYQPKVADFGLSKLLNRGGLNSNFSTIRGTRGYMAPEWISNLPITSKVDVYSYGIVVLEMITRKSPMELYTIEGEGALRLVTWVRKKIEKAGLPFCIREIMDPYMICDEYEFGKIQNMVTVAMECVKEDKDARPTMSQVVEMLVRSHEE